MGPSIHQMREMWESVHRAGTNHILSLFGGNASQVTISGESAGGGRVMLQDMAYGGSLGSSLFVNVSPPNTGERVLEY
jgi:hypothetical protein